MQEIAHINRKKEIQTVAEHCQNVAEYASLSAGRRSLSSSLYLAGCLHDAGKLSHEFQRYIAGKTAKKGTVNHSSAGGAFLLDMSDEESQLAAELIACAVYQHHGPMDCIADGEDVIEKRSINAEVCQSFLPEKQIKKLLKDAAKEINAYMKEMRKTAKEMSSNSSRNSSVNENGMFLLGCLERLILSYLVDADWRDTSEFMNGKIEERVSDSDRQKFWSESIKKAEIYAEGFDMKTEIDQLRSQMAKECLSASIADHGIYRLSMPTGGGKTVTGLRLALKLAEKHKKRHIVYVAPYLSVLEQNAEIIKNILGSDDYVLEHHSDFVTDDEETYEKLCSSWDSPVVLTTMVQFLDTMFLGKMKSVRRFNQLTDAVFIIDEAQNIPIKCISMFNGMMNFLCHITGSIGILCTATQPLFEETDRNMIIDGDILHNERYYSEKLKRNRIRIIDGQMNADELAGFALDHFDRSLLIVLNTKKAVKKLYEKIREKTDVKVMQLTTNMCAQHRLDAIAEIKKMIKEGQKVICVSTQLIEAGVDISFQCVIRSFAGIDSIMQSAGRCNRNGEYSECMDVYTVNFAEENLSSLKDIRKAKSAMLSICDLGYGDFSSVEAVKTFYKQYFFDRAKEMDYISKSGNLYELLSFNAKNVNDFHGPGAYPHYIRQSFKTAGHEFDVIEDSGMPVIVRYKGSEPYIKIIENPESDEEAIRCALKRLQRFTVICRNNALSNEYIKAVKKDDKILCFVADSLAYGECGLLIQEKTEVQLCFGNRVPETKKKQVTKK